MLVPPGLCWHGSGVASSLRFCWPPATFVLLFRLTGNRDMNTPFPSGVPRCGPSSGCPPGPHPSRLVPGVFVATSYLSRETWGEKLDTAFSPFPTQGVEDLIFAGSEPPALCEF